MSDLDPLARRLRQDMARVVWPEAAEIRARGRRRTRAHRAVGAGALGVAVLVASSVGLTLADRRGSAPVGPPSTTAPAAPPPDEGPSVVPPAAPSRLSTLDVTFVSQQVGWLLAAQTCRAGQCPVLLHTTDGGRTWTRLPAPPAGVSGYGAGVRFADTNTGYLYSLDPALLYLSRDGGRSWQRQPGYAHAIEAGNGTVLRANPDVAGCQPACHYTISRAPVGGGRWQTVLPAIQFTGTVQMVRGSHRAFVGLFGNPAGGVDAHGHLLASTDDGSTWSTRADPCGTSQGREADMTRLAAAADGSLTVLCYVHGSSPERYFLVTSIDAGAHFGPPHATPAFPLAIGAASASTLLVAAVEAGGYRLYRSVDGGAQWSVVATAPDPAIDGDLRPNEIAFAGPGTGHWIAGYDTVFRTGDSGRSWTSSRLPSP